MGCFQISLVDDLRLQKVSDCSDKDRQEGRAGYYSLEKECRLQWL
jgi:hypothetical protein